MPPAPLRVLILGAYGFFGSRLSRRLAAAGSCGLVLAGRSAANAGAFAAQLSAVHPEVSIRAVAMDAGAPALAEQLRRLEVDVLVHTAGPFQGQDYAVARACIAAGVHYIDLADGRAFVGGIEALDAEARRQDVLVVSGASSVPALSGAAIAALADGLDRLTGIDIGISPGNRTERGLATVRAILGYCGEPLPGLEAGRAVRRGGWLRHWRHAYPAPVGRRWLSDCDVPDLDLLPRCYPELQDLRFGAGLELGFLHGGLALLAWLHRLRLLPGLERFAVALKRLSDLFITWGSDAGAMHVEIAGERQGGVARRRWTLVACDGDGPYVPTLAAAALIRRLTEGRLPQRGAMPCLGLLDLADFETAAQGLAINTFIDGERA